MSTFSEVYKSTIFGFTDSMMILIKKVNLLWCSAMMNVETQNSSTITLSGDGTKADPLVAVYTGSGPLAEVYSAGGNFVANTARTLITMTSPSSLTWSNDEFNEHYIINTTSGDIPFLTGTIYYDINLQPVSVLPAKSTMHIIKTVSGIWVDASSGSGTPQTPTITGPSNESVTVGEDAIFTITVESSSDYTTQWYLNNVAITGATGLSYTKSDCQLADSGGVYKAEVTNLAGTTISSNATLTVSVAITGYMYYSPNDPGPTLRGGTDPFTYQSSFNIIHNEDIPITLPPASSPFQFVVFKIPITESVKTYFTNDQFNSGAIPGFVFAVPLTIGDYRYYYSSDLTSFTTSSIFTLKNTQ